MAMVVSTLFSTTHSIPFPRSPSSKRSNFIIHNSHSRRDSNQYRHPQIINLLDANRPRVNFSSVFVIATSIALSCSLFITDVTDASAFVVTTPRKLQADELATVRLFQANTPSVVYITNLAVKYVCGCYDYLSGEFVNGWI